MNSSTPKKSSNKSFLFVNQDANTINFKGHRGDVNAHVHATARAQRKRKTTYQRPDTPQSLQQSIHSWRLGGIPKPLPQELLQDSNLPQSAQSLVYDNSEPHKSILASNLDTSLYPSPEVDPCSSEDSPSSDCGTPEGHLRAKMPFVRRYARKTGKRVTFESNTVRRVPTDIATQVMEPAICAYLGSLSLDPFCRLPMQSNRQEREILQSYLTMTGPLIYGTRPEAAVFCPVRDFGFANIASSPLHMQWVLIAGETSRAIQQHVPEPTSLLRRKALAYRTMNEALSDPERRYSEETFKWLMMAIFVEARFSKPQLAAMHLNGLCRVLRSKGGVKSLASTYNLSFFTWVHIICDGGQIADLEELERVKESFIWTLKYMQSWNKRLRGELWGAQEHFGAKFAGRKAGPTPFSQTFLDVLMDPHALVTQYADSRKRAFLLSPQLAPFLKASYPCQNPLQRACHFTVLFLLNLVLWESRDDYAAGMRFVNRFAMHVQNNGTVDPKTGHTSLKLEGLVWTMAKARVETDTDERYSSDREVWRSLTIIDGLKAFSSLPETSRQRVIQALSGWLINDDKPEAIVEITEEDFFTMDDEITRCWQIGSRIPSPTTGAA